MLRRKLENSNCCAAKREFGGWKEKHSSLVYYNKKGDIFLKNMKNAYNSWEDKNPRAKWWINCFTRKKVHIFVISLGRK